MDSATSVTVAVSAATAFSSVPVFSALVKNKLKVLKKNLYLGPSHARLTLIFMHSSILSQINLKRTVLLKNA